MAKKDLLDQEVEMENQEQFDGAAPTAEEAAEEAKDTRVWNLEDGTEVSKSEFIREQFTKNNKSRKQISEEYGINYRTVYGATVNMVNDAEPATRGRAASSAKIKVTAEGHVITVIEGVVHVDNVAVADDDPAGMAETIEVDRNSWIKEQVEAGAARGDIASALGLSYGVIYSMTKDIEGNKQRHEMDYNGETVSRSEYIRRRHLIDGVSRSDIAKELGVDYPVVWSALKSQKSEEDKFGELVDKLGKFADKVEDGAGFAAALEILRSFKLKEVVEEAATEVATGEAAQ